MLSKDKKNLEGGTPSINLSYVGKVGRKQGDKIIIKYPEKRENIEVFARHNSVKRGVIMRKHVGVNIHNLKRGGRKELFSGNLTPHAKRMIQGGGDVFQKLVEEGGQSSVMVTLTYARNVPEHKEAKIHLRNFLRALKHKGHMKKYVWVAQLQTGKRAKEKGLYSYREEFGECIHFHILTDQIPIKLLRHVWSGIVAKWETEKGFQVSKLGGVDIRLVYNASNYISTYISKETKEGTILGGLWGISKDLRDEVGIKDTRGIKCTLQEWENFCVGFKFFSKKTVVLRDKKTLTKIYAVKDWSNCPMLFTRQTWDVLEMFEMYLRNQRKNKVQTIKEIIFEM